MRYLPLVYTRIAEMTTAPSGSGLFVTDGPFVETKEYLAGSLPGRPVNAGFRAR
jgi:hypothetical protein